MKLRELAGIGSHRQCMVTAQMLTECTLLTSRFATFLLTISGKQAIWSPHVQMSCFERPWLEKVRDESCLLGGILNNNPTYVRNQTENCRQSSELCFLENEVVTRSLDLWGLDECGYDEQITGQGYLWVVWQLCRIIGMFWQKLELWYCKPKH